MRRRESIRGSRRSRSPRPMRPNQWSRSTARTRPIQSRARIRRSRSTVRSSWTCTTSVTRPPVTCDCGSPGSRSITRVGQLQQPRWLWWLRYRRIGTRPWTARPARFAHRRAAAIVVRTVAPREILGIGPGTSARSGGYPRPQAESGGQPAYPRSRHHASIRRISAMRKRESSKLTPPRARHISVSCAVFRLGVRSGSMNAGGIQCGSALII